MKNLMYFISGIIFVFLISATTVSVITVKPQTPKHYLTKSFVMEYDSENVRDYVKLQIKNGWILKEIEGANNGQYRSTWIVVMEKY